MVMALSPADPNSHSRPEEVVTTHLHLDWRIDFSSQTVSGQTTLSCHRLVHQARTLLLDTNMLQVDRVVYNQETDLVFRLGPAGCCGRVLG